MSTPNALPPYRVRESSRARRVTLKISPLHGLEVVVPTGYDQRNIPRIISAKKDWIWGVFERIEGSALAPDPAPPLPDAILFRAIDRRFEVRYEKADSRALELRANSSEVMLSGDIADMDGCRRLLKKWLKGLGRDHLIPWLDTVSQRTGLSYRKAQVRAQKSRWGSCSGRGAISLNCSLLFLPPELVTYLLIHELCHTVQPNHSSRFWSLVAGLEPQYKALDGRMRSSMQDVPAWAR